MQVLVGVVIDGGAQGLKVGARAAGLAARMSIRSALGVRDPGQRLAAPVIIQPSDAPFKLRSIDDARTDVIEVDRQHIRDVDLLDVACQA
jgi:hypothetical protein